MSRRAPTESSEPCTQLSMTRVCHFCGRPVRDVHCDRSRSHLTGAWTRMSPKRVEGGCLYRLPIKRLISSGEAAHELRGFRRARSFVLVPLPPWRGRRWTGMDSPPHLSSAPATERCPDGARGPVKLPPLTCLQGRQRRRVTATPASHVAVRGRVASGEHDAETSGYPPARRNLLSRLLAENHCSDLNGVSRFHPRATPRSGGRSDQDDCATETGRRCDAPRVEGEAAQPPQQRSVTVRPPSKGMRRRRTPGRPGSGAEARHRDQPDAPATDRRRLPASSSSPHASQWRARAFRSTTAPVRGRR